jgi:hypothetical protein
LVTLVRLIAVIGRQNGHAAHKPDRHRTTGAAIGIVLPAALVGAVSGGQ